MLIVGSEQPRSSKTWQSLIIRESKVELVSEPFGLQLLMHIDYFRLQDLERFSGRLKSQASGCQGCKRGSGCPRRSAKAPVATRGPCSGHPLLSARASGDSLVVGRSIRLNFS